MDQKNPNLTEQEKHVLLEKGTEAPFSGKLLDNHEDGEYRCKNCGALLFASDKKFDSGTGWPSFDEALPGAITIHADTAHSYFGTEVTCANCGGHLGHVFDDGPTKTGKRFCVNSCSLDFEKK